MNANFMEELDLLEREKGVSKETILDALANAMVSAYKRSPGAAEEARVTIDTDTGEMIVYGQELDEDGNVVREWEDTPTDFGRIAAQTAKQVIVQRLRDAKRAQIFEIYQGREGDLVTGIVQQSDFRTVMLDLGNAEAVMPAGEKIPYERLERGARVKSPREFDMQLNIHRKKGKARDEKPSPEGVSEDDVEMWLREFSKRHQCEDKD